jgi:hypothetical protein
MMSDLFSMMDVVLELLCASIYMYGKLRILLDKEDSMGYILVCCVRVRV